MRRIKSYGLDPEVEIPVAPKPPRGSWGGSSYDSKGRSVRVGQKEFPAQECDAGHNTADKTTESITSRPTKPGRW